MADGDGRSSAARKAQPIATGVLAYFPRALAAISEVSRRGNEKHNQGEPLHWAKEKSTDEADSCVRHICDALEFGPLALDAEGVPNLPSAAWRMLAWLERVLEGDERWRTTPKPTTVTEKAILSRAISTANVPHSREFFEQMKTCREAYKRLALAFATVILSGSTVLDFGCGTGHQSAALARLGYNVTGADPLVDAADVEPGFEFLRGDPITVTGIPGADVVICTEVAEHVYPERADALVGAVCAAARERVIWSAAHPGQDWEGHVNLQPPTYWLDKFSANGFRVAWSDTHTLRAEMRAINAQHCGAAGNFYVLDRASAT